MSHLIFVYGTLKGGHSREGALSDQRYIGVARTTDNYALFDLSGFPGLIHAKPEIASGRKIYGELYEVSDDCIDRLDQIEGVAHEMYSRELINLEEVNLFQKPVHNNTFQVLHRKTAEAYIYLRDISKCKECGIFWSSR